MSKNEQRDSESPEPKKDDFPFDCCCPPDTAESPTPAARYQDIEQKGTLDEDDESFNSGPAPPPPGYPHPEDHKMEAEGTREEDVVYYDEEEASNRKSRATADPPLEGTEEEDEVDYEEDQSVEIPPTNVIHRMVQKERDGPAKSRNRFMSLCCCCCLVILAVILAAGYGSGAFKKDSTSRAAPDIDSDAPPELTEEEILIRAEQMATFLGERNVGGEAAFTNQNSPEAQALNWLVIDDVLRLDPSNEADQDRLVQRYALATLFLASPFQWTNQENWLSNTVPGECDGWFGVTCDANGAVTGIDLFENRVNGDLPADISLLSSMTVLNLAANEITGEIPASIGTMSNLEALFLDRNSFSQDLSGYDFSSMTGLNVLWLSDNEFSGTIPTSLFQLSGLEILVLDNNQFTGGIEGISGLTSATRVTIGNNQLSGNLPAELGDLTNIEVLWLFDNEFSGQIPGEVVNMVSLTTFDVVGNNIGGPLPTLFSTLPNLETLNLGENAFTGPIPAEYANFPSLTILNIEENNLSGPISDVLANLPLTDFRCCDYNWVERELPTWI